MPRRCVLLADRHMGVLGGLRGLVEPLFETVLMVSDENSLLEAVAKVGPDLVVVDLSLPVRREINVARRLGKAFPDLKFIVLSVHDEPVAERECLAAGAAGFVLTRTADADLVPAVEAALGAPVL